MIASRETHNTILSRQLIVCLTNGTHPSAGLRWLNIEARLHHRIESRTPHWQSRNSSIPIHGDAAGLPLFLVDRFREKKARAKETFAH
jgi:hypothetical protein